MANVDKSIEEKIIELAVEGLVTDGGHQKQWHLEEILKLVTTPRRYKFLKTRLYWAEGIPD